MDAMTKVTRLIDRIQTYSLDAVKVNIMQDSELRRDFRSCVTFYKDFIKQSSGNQSIEVRRVAEVSYYRNGNNDVKDQYYSKEEYMKISTNSKLKLGKLCEGLPQGAKPRGGGEKGSKLHKNICKL